MELKLNIIVSLAKRSIDTSVFEDNLINGCTSVGSDLYLTFGNLFSVLYSFRGFKMVLEAKKYIRVLNNSIGDNRFTAG